MVMNFFDLPFQNRVYLPLSLFFWPPSPKGLLWIGVFWGFPKSIQTLYPFKRAYKVNHPRGTLGSPKLGISFQSYLV